MCSERPIPELSSEENDSLFTQSVAAQAETKVRQLQELREELEQAKPLMQMRKSAGELRKRNIEVNGRFERLQGQIQVKESQLQTEEASLYNMMCHCPERPSTCPVNAAKRVGATAGQSTEAIGRLNQELTDLRRQRSEVQAELDTVSSELNAAETVYEHAEAKHGDDLRKLGEAIGRWQAHSEEVKDYDESSTRSRKAERRVKKVSSEIDRSEQILREGRQRQARLVDQLSTLYGQVLTEMLGQETMARLQFDGNGIQPKPATTLRTNGLAMATLATVLGFDLTALRAAVEGLCPMPGFLIHDSPKASDLESALYDRIYEPILRMDPTNPEQEPAFQYILTTTTPPPDAAAEPPYVRERLHAMTPEGETARYGVLKPPPIILDSPSASRVLDVRPWEAVNTENHW